MTARMDTLIGDGFAIVQFADLPQHCQMATVWFTAIEGGGWDNVPIDPAWESDDEAKAGLAALLPRYVEHYGEELFGLVTLGVDALKASIMQDEDFSSNWDSWEAFHASYGTGASEHPSENRWPVLLSPDNYATLWDGWHRFNSYLRDGATEIQAMFNPQAHHLKSRN